MPDERSHRGAHPQDGELFAADAVPRLRSAAGDLSWLLSRGYASPSATKLVGDRHALDARQRVAVQRCACADAARARRKAHEVSDSAVGGQTLHVDGYNLLTTVEAALGGGVILLARDGTLRDVASLHGTWRKVEETPPALAIIGEVAAALGAAGLVWYLDSPVSNSGRLKALIEQTAVARDWEWRVELVPNPDPLLATSGGVVVTADSVILDACRAWHNLARRVVSQRVPSAWVVDLRGD